MVVISTDCYLHCLFCVPEGRMGPFVTLLIGCQVLISLACALWRDCVYFPINILPFRVNLRLFEYLVMVTHYRLYQKVIKIE